MGPEHHRSDVVTSHLPSAKHCARWKSRFILAASPGDRSFDHHFSEKENRRPERARNSQGHTALSSNDYAELKLFHTQIL